MDQSHSHAVARNAGIMLASQAVTWISGFMLLLVLPRWLGSAAFGHLFLAITITTMLQVIIDFGGSYILPKEVARSQEAAPTLYANAMASRVVLWVIGMVILAAFTVAVGYGGEILTLLAILGTAKLWESFNKVHYGFFQGREMMQYPCLGNISDRIALVTVGIPAVLLGASGAGIAAIMAASSLLSLLVVLQFRSRIVSRIPRVNWKGAITFLRRSVPYFLWTVFSTIYYRIDAVVLSLFVSSDVIGWYGASYRLFDALMFLPSILTIAVFPALSRLRNESASSLGRMTQRSLEIVLLAALPAGILMFAYADRIIDLLFGIPSYAASVPILRILAVTLILVYVDFVLTAALFACDRQRQWSFVAFSAILVNVALNVVAIPFAQSTIGNGAVGAAVTTTATELFILINALALLPRGVLNRKIPQAVFGGVVSAIAMSVFVWYVSAFGYPWMLTAIAGMSIYGTGLFASGTIGPEERALIRQFLSGVNIRRLFAAAK